jgi:hypothetical protein
LFDLKDFVAREAGGRPADPVLSLPPAVGSEPISPVAASYQCGIVRNHFDLRRGRGWP